MPRDSGASCCLLIGGTALAQKPPVYLLEDPYITRLSEILRAWDEGTLELPTKATLTPLFKRNLDQVLSRQEHAYQNPRWADEMFSKFGDLPEQVKPQVPLTQTAKGILLLLAATNLRAIEARGEEAFSDSVNLSLFMLLGHAQEELIKTSGVLEDPRLNSPRVTSSLFHWWTAIWPFCR